MGASEYRVDAGEPARWWIAVRPEDHDPQLGVGMPDRWHDGDPGVAEDQGIPPAAGSGEGSGGVLHTDDSALMPFLAEADGEKHADVFVIFGDEDANHA